MSKTTQAADIDTFALNLMLDVWKIGNSHGPDSQRKAKIQCRLIDALKEFAAPIANTPADRSADSESALFTISKWLNEELTAPIDRVALATVCAAAQSIIIRAANTPAIVDKTTKQPLPWVAKSMESQQRDYGRISTSTGSYVADFMHLEDAQLVVERMNPSTTNTPAVPDANALAEFMDKTAHNCSQSWYEFAKKICEWLATPTANDQTGGE